MNDESNTTNNDSASPWVFGIDAAASLADAPAEEPNLFEVGDVVTLITGSPEMAVVHACKCGDVEVVWYDDNGINHDVLPGDVLSHV